MRRVLAQIASLRVVQSCVLASCAVCPSFAFGNQLYVTSDAVDIVRRYAGATGVQQGVLLTSFFTASGQLGIHFGATNNRVLVGHFVGGVQEFNATTGAYIKTYNPGGGTQWAGLYAPNGNVILGDWATGNVSEYNSTTAAFVQLLTNLSDPADMLIGPNGNLYICSFGGGFVREVLVTNGTFVSQWAQPPFTRTNDIAFNANGEILVTGMTFNQVYRYNAIHTLLGSFAGTGWGNTHGIAISPWSGNVLVVDGISNQVHEFHPTTYVELNTAFLSPAPGAKIVDLAFFRASPSLSTPFCYGDGTVVACPCGNTGALGHGCASAAFPGGAILTDSGVAGASIGTDTLVLMATDIPGPALFLQANGLAPTPINFGDGHLCASVGIIRLGIVFSTGGIASYPGGLTAAPIHAAGFVNAGDVKHYQAWYRSVPGLCGPNNHNLTQGLTITWGP